MILGIAYMLYLYRRVIFGQLTQDDLTGILDLSPREIAVFAPLILLTLWMGIYPSSFSSFWDAAVEHHGRASPGRAAGDDEVRGGCCLMNWTLAVPEIVLSCCGMAILLFGVLRGATRSSPRAC